MPRKQSSPRLSTTAARILRECQLEEKNGWRYSPPFLIKDIKALCASVLSQDETKGQKRAIRKRK